jgi:asparagine synthetase B (glutamine-hydrolysing)
MCGIGGVINANGAAIKLEEIDGLARDLHHRGPDGPELS